MNGYEAREFLVSKGYPKKIKAYGEIYKLNNIQMLVDGDFEAIYGDALLVSLDDIKEYPNVYEIIE